MAAVQQATFTPLRSDPRANRDHFYYHRGWVMKGIDVEAEAFAAALVAAAEATDGLFDDRITLPEDIPSPRPGERFAHLPHRFAVGDEVRIRPDAYRFSPRFGSPEAAAHAGLEWTSADRAGSDHRATT